MTDNTHNGWTNYETWAVNLWLSNESGSYEYWLQRARDIAAELPSEPKREHEYKTAAVALAEELSDHHDEYKPEVSGVYADLLQAALDAVEWREVAASLLDTVAEDQEA